MKVNSKSVKLYAVTDREWLEDSCMYMAVGQAIRGGVTMVQYREKMHKQVGFEREAERLLRLCRRYRVPMIVNNDVELTRMIDADGVHLGRGGYVDFESTEHLR